MLSSRGSVAWRLSILVGALTALAIGTAPLASAQVLDRRFLPVPANYNRTGIAVALDGEWACAIDRFNRAHMYRRGAAGWAPHSILTLMTFGLYSASVDIDGTRMAVGTATSPGVVTIFDWSGSQWVLQYQSTSTPSFAFEFGAAIDLRGDELLVGAKAAGPTPANGGKAFLLRRNPHDGTWNIAVVLIDPAAAANDNFGSAVRFAADGEELLIGAPGDDNSAGIDAGAVHRFRRAGGNFVHLEEILPSDSAPGARFGSTLDVSEERFAVGAPELSPLGAAFVYEQDPGGWVQSAALFPPPDSFDPVFGSALALDGDRLLLGCPLEHDQRGSALLYRLGVEGWAFETRYAWREVEDAPVIWHGEQVALDAGEVFISAVLADAPGAATQAGALYFGNYADELRPYCFCAEGAPCANGVATTGCRHDSQRPGAQLGGYGSTSVAADDLTLRMFGLPPQANGIVFSSLANSEPAPLADGLRCVGVRAATFRFAVLTASATGVAELGPGVVGIAADRFPRAGEIDAGETWYFQGWFRSPGGACDAGSNLTSAVAIDFVP